jgi:glutamate/tyrosine decarboxylase-like PLP-dependent enzyme
MQKLQFRYQTRPSFGYGSTAREGRQMRDADMGAILENTKRRSLGYLEVLAGRTVAAPCSGEALRQELEVRLTLDGEAAEAIVDSLADAAAKGTVAMSGPRYFGFVIGGHLPAALAADWLVSTWDQNSTLYVMSPMVSVIEQITAAWLKEFAGLPQAMSVGFVTGCQMANFTGLAAARHRVLQNVGWNVERDGLFGAPPVDVFVSEEAHYTISMALRLLGLGGERVTRVATDSQGRMRADELAAAMRDRTGPSIVCAQAGNVNSGAFDPLEQIADVVETQGGWLHVDGAFGLWAAASPRHAALVRGVERAHSIATDAHKWLNVPYDCGVVFCADQAAHRSAMSQSAAYIAETTTQRDPHEFVPEESRRARAVPVYAALRSLGRQGLASLVERSCDHARRFAQGLLAAGFEVLNEVVLNQVLVAFGDAERTLRTIAAIQREGTCWCGSSVWHGRTAMRISVSNWSTTTEDVERSLDAMVRVAQENAAS